jgi:hypothetical protein
MLVVVQYMHAWEGRFRQCYKCKQYKWYLGTRVLDTEGLVDLLSLVCMGRVGAPPLGPIRLGTNITLQVSTTTVHC